ncbi:DUF1045 domain-containing protein [Roseovarius spongiae]|uniref:DUF1045 domain-containing protein n=1 Tax=Roseovarius spongiae TaxID=2320272 RepID=A0A3A8B970_9RHOB|nr:DUF1045 domain-containing protein [Roseovarius spongiae]RKF14695.1 DUF1045 domain-containing protein [Roseovarius spongiae]
MFRRYAVYYTPPENDALARWGAAWLGWDIARGREVAHPEINGLPAPAADLTATPRRYGLHATMRPPFALAPGQRPDEVETAFAALCAEHAPVELAGLELAALGRFVALVPTGPTPALDALAAEAVRRLDMFRARLSDAELSRRRQAVRSERQAANLMRWGYPHVLEAFRFHLTLSDKLPRAQTAALHGALAPHVAPLLPAPMTIDALSLVGEDAAGRFRLILRTALTG